MSDTTTPAQADAIQHENTQQPAPSADPSATPPAAQETGGTEAEASADKPRDDKGRFEKRTDHLQRQISELTAQKHAVRREVEALERQKTALANQYRAAAQVDPNDPEAYETARIQKATIGVQHGVTQQQARDAVAREAEIRHATYVTKIDAAREKFPDLDQSIAQFERLPLSDFAADLIVESERTAEIVNYFAKNPGEQRRIAALPPAYQGAEIARIEAKVSSLPMKRISQAPAPVQTVSGGAGNPGVDLSAMSMADYIKAREAGAR